MWPRRRGLRLLVEVVLSEVWMEPGRGIVNAAAYVAEQRAHRLAYSLQETLEILARVTAGKALDSFDRDDIQRAKETLAEDGEL
ncbi:hypothetical protein LCGC14_2529490 [marine sediment metagenome]|uniref:Uncharacterized protein n=1 Tax=marine sediment metagenome TaxID=412755 RepID=A0A0F9AUD9_9ZZZZ